MISLKEYLEYSLYNRDDNPLYVFEKNLDEHPTASEMLKDYEPPKFFRQDFLAEALGKNAPPHRWLVIGPKRSGS